MEQWIPIVEDEKGVLLTKNRIDDIYYFIKEYYYGVDDLTLYTGKLGLCLFLYYYSFIDKRNTLWKEYYCELNQEIANLSIETGYEIACNMNFVWFTSHIHKKKDCDFAELDDFFKDSDEFFFQLMLKYIRNNSYDLLYGATQIASYFLDRFIFAPLRYRKYLDVYVELLYAQADKLDNNRLTWKSMIDSSQPDVLGYNLGLAHGIPSLIMFFSKLKNKGYSHPLLDKMLLSSCYYMLSIEQNFKISKSHFGVRLLPGQVKSEMSRIGWCYGDLGIASAFFYASKYDKGNLNLKDKSIEIICDTFDRINQKDTLIVDNCLCHGTAGVAIMYDLLFRNIDDPRCKKNAIYWYLQTINEPYDANYYAGYKIYKGDYMYKSDLSFLSGISGIGLSLISSIYNVSPDWCEFLLLE